MKRRGDVVVGWGEGTLVGLGSGEEGKKKGRRRENPSTPRATFLRIQGNRFRDRKGAALIALPARSRGLGTRSFSSSLSLPLSHVFCSYPPSLTKLDISTDLGSDLPQGKPTCPTLIRKG